jgi:hypothetical protein
VKPFEVEVKGNDASKECVCLDMAMFCVGGEIGRLREQDGETSLDPDRRGLFFGDWGFGIVTFCLLLVHTFLPVVYTSFY